MASHCPFSPPPPPSPYVPFPVPILDQQGELSLFWWRGGRGRVGGTISSDTFCLWPWSRCKTLLSSAWPWLLEKLFPASLVELVLGGELTAGSEWTRYILVIIVPAVLWKAGFSSKLLQEWKCFKWKGQQVNKAKLSELCKPLLGSAWKILFPINEERDKNSKTWGKFCLLASLFSVFCCWKKSQAEHMRQDPISCSRPDRLLGCSDNLLI